MEVENSPLSGLLRKPISRRDFLVGLGFLIGGAVLASNLVGRLAQAELPGVAKKEEGRLGLRQGNVPPPEGMAK
jgi:hypothetical protein